MLFKEIISVYSENHTKSIIELMIIKSGGTYSYHCAFKVLNVVIYDHKLCGLKILDIRDRESVIAGWPSAYPRSVDVSPADLPWNLRVPLEMLSMR
jgi:hypothetical protein